jgi:hypothetical protein
LHSFSDFNNNAHVVVEDRVHRADLFDFREQQSQSGPGPAPKLPPHPHPPMSPPPKDLVQHSAGSNEYAKRRRQYSKVGIAIPSDYTKQVKEYLKAVTANKIAAAAFNNEGACL